MTLERAIFSAEAARGWLPWGALAPFLCLLFVVLPVLATDPPMTRAGWLDGTGDPIGVTGLILFLLVPFALTGLLVLGWTAWVERRPFATIGLGSGGGGAWLRGIGIGAATILGVVVAAWLAGGYHAQGYGLAFAQPAALATIAVLLLSFVVQAGVEELLFRGWLLSVTVRKFGFWVAIAINAAVFALLHFGPGQPLLVTFNVVLFAVFACVWAMRAGHIWGVMGWHAGWNWLLATGFEVPVTGLDAHQPALLIRLIPAGPDTLTGGAQGPEGGLFCTVFFVAGIALIVRSIRKRAPVA